MCSNNSDHIIIKDAAWTSDGRDGRVGGEHHGNGDLHGEDFVCQLAHHRHSFHQIYQEYEGRCDQVGLSKGGRNALINYYLR